MQLVKFGAVYPQPEGGVDVLDFADKIEAWGYDSIWQGEHITNWWRPTFDAMTVCAAFAARTKRVQIGTSIVLLPLHHPTILAKEAVTLDHVSGGRFILGVGIGGENKREFDSCGAPHAERGRRANEQLEVMRSLWTDQKTTYQGRYFTLQDTTMDPKPLTPGGLPVWVGGRRDAALRRTARYAQGWMPYLYAPEQYRDGWARVQAYAHEAGRDPAGITPGLYQFICVGRTVAEAARVAAQSLQERYNQPFDKVVERYVVLGTPQDCARRLEEFIAAGARHILFSPTCPLDEVMAQFEAIARDVLPLVRRKESAG
ncbi:MAG: LLM class flavin-dependent oxidoreductase [Dehalococcoidia bacterium]|nr:LLM class flavin-dependent oxidoreductase [Dehalococcoidia bacterium]